MSNNGRQDSLLIFIKALLQQAAIDMQQRPEILTKKEAAEFLRISNSALERFAFKLHEIPYSKPGKHAVFLTSDLLKWLKERRIPSIYDQGV